MDDSDLPIPPMRKSTASVTRWFGIIVMVLTLPHLLLGVGLGVYSAWIIWRSVETEGIVTRFDYDDGCCVPIFVFSDSTGANHEVRGNMATDPCAFDYHERVKVLYTQANPNMAYIKSFSTLWMIPMVFTFIAGAFQLTGAMWYGHFSRKMKMADE